MTNETKAAIERLEATRAVHVSRGALFVDYVAECDRMIARLRAGLPLTRYQRGLPSDVGAS